MNGWFIAGKATATTELTIEQPTDVSLICTYGAPGIMGGVVWNRTYTLTDETERVDVTLGQEQTWYFYSAIVVVAVAVAVLIAIITATLVVGRAEQRKIEARARTQRRARELTQSSFVETRPASTDPTPWSA
jgi:hypothetical protein